ncbi:lipase [Enterococcus sp. CU12B]|uniref:Lipase n=2 Tax=Candidatus Enterococcus willemsii TaxID=1857215 RepID=A0ABQ6Z2Y5_9ENTE|nr:lipase [Enterococcus sp. CU12B]
MKIKQLLMALLGVCLLIAGTFLVLQLSVPKAGPRLEVAKQKEEHNQKESIRYTALGDSLTEGVGDDTQKGGFVPIVANDLQSEFKLSRVDIENYGVAGERSDQILKRLNKEEAIQTNIAKSDIVTLTVGGNDLMKVINNNIFGLSIKSFDKPIKKYQKQLTELLETMRELNPDAPIYVLGIYNPFYVNFPEITDMQTIVDNWNDGTEAVVDEMKNVYFIPINDVIASGLNGTTSSTQESSNSEGNDLNIVKNDALYEEDKFHPNNLGYQLMAKSVKAEITRTKEQWLLKEEK